MSGEWRTQLTEIIRELTLTDLQSDLLKHFNHYQEVKRCVRKVDGDWVLQDISFLEQWDEQLKQEIVTDDFAPCIQGGGSVYGVFNEENQLIGFASLLASPMGSQGQYRKLMQMHISYEYRGRGLGKALFLACVQKAKEMGAHKLYMSTHSAEESQAFYNKLGCVDAEELDEWSVTHEPYDRQMEYVL
jgi:N-acetylglutamate synthase-like GNAT family acetyltransferase